MLRVVHEDAVPGGWTIRYASQFWERYWINEIFSFPHNLKFRDVLVINTWHPYEEILRSIPDQGNMILVIVDEQDGFPRELLPQFGAVIRVGFHNGGYPPNTTTIPLYVPVPVLRAARSWKLWFSNARSRILVGVSGSEQRKYLWSFAGDGHKNREREEMLTAFSSIFPGRQHIFQGWLPPDALDPHRYTSLLRESVFVPCPRGSLQIECYRAYEAAYLGAIPVVISDYYAKQFDAPFLIAPDWREAARQIVALQKERSHLASLQRAVTDWISALPAITRAKLREHLIRSEAKTGPTHP
jgi:hypothetical protein